MPRVENQGPAVEAWLRQTGKKDASQQDVCTPCWYKLYKDPHVFDDQMDRYLGDPLGEDGWGGEADHPDYSEDGYSCANCGRELSEDRDQ